MTDLIKRVGGIEAARKIIYSAPMWATGYNTVSKAYFGGDIFSYDQEFYLESLVKAIADYNTDHCVNIENHLSPSTKVYNESIPRTENDQ